MKVLLKDILVYRSLKQAKGYIIEDSEGVFHIVYGSRIRSIEDGILFDSVQKFIQDKLSWEKLEIRIVRDRNEDSANHWVNWKEIISEKANEYAVDVEKLFINGELTDIKKLDEF